MIITATSQLGIKLSVGDTSIAVNPPDASATSEKVSKFSTNLMLSSVAHPLMYGVDTVTYKDTKPFIIASPGSYEREGISVMAVGAITSFGEEDFMSTQYSFMLDGMKVVIIGPLDSKDKITADMFEELGTPDIAIVYVGDGGDMLKAQDAFTVVKNLGAHLAVVATDSDNTEAATTFAKEANSELEVMDKLTLKSKDIVTTGMRVVQLQK